MSLSILAANHIYLLSLGINSTAGCPGCLPRHLPKEICPMQTTDSNREVETLGGEVQNKGGYMLIMLRGKLRWSLAYIPLLFI